MSNGGVVQLDKISTCIPSFLGQEGRIYLKVGGLAMTVWSWDSSGFKAVADPEIWKDFTSLAKSCP